MCGCGWCTGICGYVVWVVDAVCAYGFMCCVDVPVVWMARCRLGSVLCWCVGVWFVWVSVCFVCGVREGVWVVCFCVFLCIWVVGCMDGVDLCY